MKKRYIVGISILVALLITFFNSFSIIHQNEYGVVRQFGKNIYIEKEPGIIFKIPFIQSLSTIPKEIQIYDLSATNVNTSDKKTMISDCFVLWKITDPEKYCKTSKTIQTAESRISVAVYNKLKTSISSLKQEEVIQGKDGTLSQQISDKLKDSMSSYGIEIISLDIKSLDLPSANKKAVYKRMKSERDKIASEYKAIGDKEANFIKNETNKTVRTIKSNAKMEAQETIAEGEREYMKIIASAYGSEDKEDFYNYLRGLEAIKTAIPKDSTIYMDSASPLIDIIKGK